MAQLKDLIVNGNARIINDLNVSGYETVGETVKVGRDPTANLEVATKQYVDNNAGNTFVATYGTTTYAEITSALSNDKMVYVNIGSGLYVPYQYTTNDVSGNEHDFASWVSLNELTPETYVLIHCYEDDTIGTNGWNAVQQRQITTSVTSSSTGGEIPTALAVYNAIQGGGGGGGTTVTIREWS